MGVRQRLLELARANLNALLNRAAASEMSGLSEEELRAELERRDRERAALDEDRKRRDQAEAEAKARARTRPSGPPRRPSSRASRIAELSRTLGVSPRASAEEAKRAYRALMREHHPDKHAGDPRKQKEASERAAAITTAYAELERLRDER